MSDNTISSVRILKTESADDMGYLLQSVDWQIAKGKPIFTADYIVFESLDDEVNLEFIDTELEIESGVQYYSRSRDKKQYAGYTEWSDISEIKIYDLDKNRIEIDMPSSVNMPTIVSNVDRKNATNGMFGFNISGFSVLGGATHKCTNYILEDINGNVIFTRFKSQDRLEELLVNELFLQPNSVYRLRVSFEATNNDVTPMATYTLKTADYMDANVIITKEFLMNVDSGEDSYLLLSVPSLADGYLVEWYIKSGDRVLEDLLVNDEELSVRINLKEFEGEDMVSIFFRYVSPEETSVWYPNIYRVADFIMSATSILENNTMPGIFQFNLSSEGE
jgi:hypothetical protein